MNNYPHNDVIQQDLDKNAITSKICLEVACL